MNKILLTIILFALAVGLVVGVINPIVGQIKIGGQKTFDSVKNTNNNISVNP